MPSNNVDDLMVPADTQELLSYKDLAHAVLEKLWLVALCVVVALFLGGAYVRRTPPTYRSIATLQVETADINILAVQQAQPMDYYNQELRNTFVENMRSEAFLLRVAKAADLADDPAFLPFPKDGHRRSDEEIAGILTGMVSAAVRPSTRLIDISVEHTNPAIAQKIANEVARSFILQNVERGVGATSIALKFLYEEVGKEEKNLKEAESALQDYREEHRTVSFDDGKNIILDRLKDLNGRVTSLRTSKIEMDADLQQMEKLRNNPDALLLLPSVANHTLIVGIKHQITMYESEIATMATRYGERHPKMIQAHQRIDEYKKSMREVALKMPDIVRSDNEKVTSQLASLEQELKEAEQANLELDRNAIPYAALTRQVETNKALYDAVLKRLKDAEVAQHLDTDAVHVVQDANLPGAPFKPNVQKILIIAFFGGVTVAFALVYLLHLADTSLKTIDQVEKVTGLAVLSGIPMVKAKKSKRDAITQAFHDENSSVAESFRSLRAALSLIMARPGESSGISLIFTSASPGEGKTFSCTNYAAVLARQGLRTLLVDADLRRPVLHDILLHQKQSEPGFSDFLDNKAGPLDLIVATEIPGLCLLPAGTVLDRPAELLANGAPMIAYFDEEMRRHFDWVIYDSAPINILADTSLLIPHIRSTALVIQACRTPRAAVMRALETIQKAGGDITGVAFNKVPPSPSGYYYYGYRYYHQKYGNRAYARTSSVNGQNGHSAAPDKNRNR